MKKVISLLMTAALLAVSLVGCGGNSSQPADTSKPDGTTTPDASSQVAAPTEPKYGGTLNVALNSNIKNMDPLYIDSSAAEQIMLQIGETLVANTEDVKDYVPQIATEWKISDDGLQYVFKLRDDVHFHPGEFQDGRLMTAEDVAYSINRSKGYFCNYLWMLDRVDVTGENEVTAYLNQADATFLYQLTHSSTVIVPKEEVEGWIEKEGQIGFTNHFVGTGPFMLKSHQADSKSVLVRNENYWGPKPYLDEVVYHIISNEEQRVNGLRTGEIDIIQSVAGQSIDLVENDKNLTLLRTPGFLVNFIGFNMENEILKNDKVREALVRATDYDALANGVYSKGEGVATRVNLPKLSWAYDDKLQDLVPSYDIEKAKQLLKEAGYENGFTITATYKDNALSTRALTILQQMWKQNLNVDLKISPVESTTYMDMLINGTIEVWAAGQYSSPDPATSVGYQFNTEKLHSNYNAWCYSDPEVDAWIAEAVSENDRAKRVELYHKIMNKAVPANVGIFYGNGNIMWGIRNNVHGVVQTGKGIMLTANNGVNIWKD